MFERCSKLPSNLVLCFWINEMLILLFDFFVIYLCFVFHGEKEFRIAQFGKFPKK